MMGSKPVAPVALPSLVPIYGTGRRGYVDVTEAPIVAFALVDPEDYEEVMQHRWHLTDTGYAARWYGGRPPNRKRERMHRRLLGLAQEDPRQGEHRNRCKLDNRKANLRVAPLDADNKQNVPSRGGTSEHRGVSWDASRGKWAAQARTKGKRLSRYFSEENEAADAVRAWRAAHMPFAVD